MPAPSNASSKVAFSAVHSWELQYVFGMLGDNANQPADRSLSDQVQQYWTNFAKTGNPNGKGLPEWRAFAAAEKSVMELGDRPGPRPLADAAKFDVFARYFEQGGGGR